MNTRLWHTPVIVGVFDWRCLSQKPPAIKGAYWEREAGKPAMLADEISCAVYATAISSYKDLVPELWAKQTAPSTLV